jgi:starch-binding outer membrane protein, SusD/RagB family
MKATTKYIAQLFLAGMVCMASCKKLDLNPTSQLSTTIFWKTPSDADLALTGLYNTLYANDGTVDQYAPYWWDCFSDNAYSQHNLGGAQSALIAGLTPTSGSYQLLYYQNSYVAIAAINSFLANVGKVLSGVQLNQYKGEAFFLRGFNYFWLAQLYGNVPIVTADPFTIGYQSKMAKSPRANVLKQAENDFDSAIANLPDTTYSTGHAIKASAEGFQIRLYLFEQRFAEAAAMAQKIISGNLFSLNPNYPSNFYKPDQSSSPEIIFSVEYQLPAIPHPYSLNVLLIGPGWKDAQGTQDMINEYEPGDPRKTMTFFFPGDGPAQGWPYPGTVGTPGVNEWVVGFYTAKKGVDPTVINPVPGLLDDQDYVLLRYADIKLMYAEAQNEAVGPDATVYQQVNDVRARPGVNMPPLPAGLSQSDMRQKIWHERRVELALEGLRYFDLRRWGIATQKLNGFVQNPTTPSVTTMYKDNYAFWPIPQTEIDLNQPDLIQNDGY